MQRQIKKLRKLLGFTQYGLCCEAGIQYSRLVYFETGRCHLKAEELLKIERAFARRKERVVKQVQGAVS
jgi:transcriptional regulator with XRE-family HTH domain